MNSPQPKPAGTWFTYSGGMEGWVDLSCSAMHRRESNSRSLSTLTTTPMLHHINDKTTRLNASMHSCLFNASAVARGWHLSREPLLADRWSPKFPMFQSYRSSAFMGKVHKIFHTCRAPLGLFTVKVWGGYSRKFWENRQKPGIFALVHAKACTVFTLGGQRSRSNVHLVGHCLVVPQPF